MVTVIDLFAGAGGFGLGAEQAGCDEVRTMTSQPLAA